MTAVNIVACSKDYHKGKEFYFFLCVSIETIYLTIFRVKEKAKEKEANKSQYLPFEQCQSI